MSIRTPSDHILVKQSVAPQLITDTTNGTGVDCLGWETLQVIPNVGDIPTGDTVTIKLQESSDDGDSDAYADITGATTAALAPAADDEPYTFDVNLSERERYIRAVVSETGAGTSIVGVIFNLMDGRTLPPTQDNTPIQVGYART